MGRCQKVPKFDFQSQFSMSKIIRIFLIFFSLKNINFVAHFLLLTFFDNINFWITLLLKWCAIFDRSPYVIWFFLLKCFRIKVCMFLHKQFQPNVTSHLIVLEAAVCLVQGFTTLLRCCCSNFSSCYVSPFRFFCHLFSAQAKEVHITIGNKS